MSNKKRARRFLPYETDYKLLDKCRDAEKKGLYMVSILSIIIPVLNEFLNNKAFMGVKDALQVIDFITINEQIQNIAQKKDTLCRRMYN